MIEIDTKVPEVYKRVSSQRNNTRKHNLLLCFAIEHTLPFKIDVQAEWANIVGGWELLSQRKLVGPFLDLVKSEYFYQAGE